MESEEVYVTQCSVMIVCKPGTAKLDFRRRRVLWSIAFALPARLAVSAEGAPM